MGIANEWLAPLEYRLITDNIDVAKLRQIIVDVRQDRKRISIRDLNELLFIEARDEEVAKEINRYSGKGIVFCESVAHAEYFLQFLPHARTYHSQKTREENLSTLEMFRRGKIEFIIVVDKFNEGIDIPDAERIVFLRVTDSKRIFLQQLGRGLRKTQGKEKVIVLDFVGNCNRLQQVKEIIDRVRMFAPPNPRNAPVVVSGRGFEFLFQDVQVEILDLIGRSFYATWQKASEAAQRLGIKDTRVYKQEYQQDTRLHSAPDGYYPDFPGWGVFLGSHIYPTWQEAGRAAQLLGCRHSDDYGHKYKQDARLRRDPSRIYDNFPGWSIFLAKKKEGYATWQEASIATQRLGIKTQREYNLNYRKDKKLWSSPSKVYPDFPRWPVFLGRSYVSKN